METNQISALQSSSAIVRKISVKAILSSIILLSAGLMLIYSYYLTPNSMVLQSLLVIAGVIALTTSAVVLIRNSKQMVVGATGSKVLEKELYFVSGEQHRLLEAVEDNKCDFLEHIRKQETGAVMMKLIYSVDRQYAEIQLFEFVPYSYVPISSVCIKEGIQADKILKYLL